MEACLWCGLGDPVLKSSFLAMVVHCLPTTSILYDVGLYDFQSDINSATIAQKQVSSRIDSTPMSDDQN